jgi:hypothetical protein
MKLVVPMPPNLANGRMHWRKKHTAKVAYWQTLDTLLVLRQLPLPPTAPLSPVTLGSTLYLWAHMDDDNALARIKWAADWLKTRGYIVDDRRPHCKFLIPEQHIDRADQRLVLTLALAAA